MTVMSNRVTVGKNVVLDGRRALFHKSERWLAEVLAEG